MDGTQTTASGLASVEATLREQLAQGDAALSAATPVLQRLLAHHDPGLINDEVAARVRGMITDLARQLLDARGLGEDVSGSRGLALVAALAGNGEILAHLHALALEGRLADRLEAHEGIDPVLSPLLEDLIAGDDEVLAGAAMAVVTAQAGFIEQQRRMTLPVGELPLSLFDAAIAALRGVADGIEAAEATLRRNFDEGQGRPALLTRLIMRTGSNAPGVLDAGHAGLGVFVTALALAAGQERGVTVMSLASRQPARLVLALRSAGLSPAAVEAQLLHFHPDASPPEAIADLRADAAAAILARDGSRGGR
jgi:hypothetical protein